MKRPSLALTAICKNEESHMERWLKCWMPLVDHIYLTDTGSTDKTLDIIRDVGGDKVTLLHFDWIKDFAAARNHALPFIKEDYIVWSDLDDSITNPEGFVKWRDSIMYMCDVWLAAYDYAHDPKTGQSVCSFMRERVWKNNKGLKFYSFVHEGLLLNVPNLVINQTPAFEIRHLRTVEDLAKDKGRNLDVFKYHEQKGMAFDSRQLYYFGKEYFEADDIDNAIKYLGMAVQKLDLELHDRIISLQYLALALFKKEKFVECISIAQQGLLVAPSRAEFYVVIGDAYIKMNKIVEAIPSYMAATKCIGANPNGFGSFIFSHATAYGPYPLTQLARCFLNLQQFQEAEKFAVEADTKFPNEESALLLKEIRRLTSGVFSFKDAKECDDIVITALGGAYEWDSKVYKEKGVGGSETAAIQMATHIRNLTGRRVIVFNTPRTEDYVDENGVEYLKAERIQAYFSSHKPALHIAWRHSVKLTDAKTIVWSHDLFTPGTNQGDYDKYLCLSEFHKNYVNTVHGIPEEKIHLTRNGIVKELWKDVDASKKNPNKILYVSSWDRGLDRCINVLDLVRGEFPDIELHVFYGAHNMKAQPGPMRDLAERLEKMMADRPWIKNHGAVKQSDLYKHYQDASLFVYPLNFIETYCISLLEVLACKVFPVVRSFGAVTSTLGPYADKGMGELIPFDAATIDETMKWADIVKKHLKEKSWEKVEFDLEANDWQHVAKQWIEDFGL